MQDLCTNSVFLLIQLRKYSKVKINHWNTDIILADPEMRSKIAFYERLHVEYSRKISEEEKHCCYISIDTFEDGKSDEIFPDAQTTNYDIATDIAINNVLNEKK